MSSLLQFMGRTSRRGVELQFYQTEPGSYPFDPAKGENPEPKSPICCEAVELVDCHICQGKHPRLHTAWRKPVGMFGCWVVFRYNGAEQVPDLSIPIAVHQIPKGANILSATESSELWHKS